MRWNGGEFTPSDDDSKKRRRINLACIQCRDRKVRCDGAQPKCTRCVTRGTECNYAKRKERPRFNPDYVRGLEEQIERLSGRPPVVAGLIDRELDAGGRHQDKGITGLGEDMDTRSATSENTPRSEDGGPGPGVPGAGGHGVGGVGGLSGGDGGGGGVGLSGGARNGAVATGDAAGGGAGAGTGANDMGETPDAMGAGAIESDRTRQDFYGPAAAVSFVRLVEAAIVGNDDPSPASSSESRMPHESDPLSVSYLNHLGSTTDITINTIHSDWSLPPRELADSYVKSYFTYVYTLYPFVHEPSFLRAYQELWTETKPSLSKRKSVNETHVFFCILNIVFSFGCLFTSGFDTPSKESSSDIYFKKARSHVNFDILDASECNSLYMLQVLLMCGQYLQATNKPAACWNVVGVAIRVGQELGLYRESHVRARTSIIEQEMSRRLWYGCILMDRTVSMTFGRPLMISTEFKVGPPTFVDDKFISDRGIAYPPEAQGPFIISFFEQTLKLYEILADVLRFYETQDTGVMDTDGFRQTILPTIFEMQSKVRAFAKQVPPHLRLDRINQHSINSQFRRLTNVLQIRIWHLEIMVYRPVLIPHTITHDSRPLIMAQESREGGLEALEDSMERTICRMCVMAATRIIALIYENSNSPNLPNMWYNIFYVYTSALVLLAAKIRPGFQDVYDASQMDSSWKYALDLLRSFERHSISATRCLKMLEMLHGKISTTKPGARPIFEFLPRNSEPQYIAPESDLFSAVYGEGGPFADPSISYTDLLRM